MVTITVRGNEGYDNGAVGITSTLAMLSALRADKKTLVLQFAVDDTRNVERLLIGKLLFEGEDEIEIANEGIDVLLRDVESVRLKKKDFAMDCHAMFPKNQNLLDVAFSSTKNDMTVEYADPDKFGLVKDLLENAAAIYDVTICLLPSKDNSKENAFLNAFEQIADKNIVCVKQGKAKTIRTSDAKKLICAIPEFDRASVFREKNMAKMVGCKECYGVDYCTGFADACRTGQVYSFIRTNRNMNNTDANYGWLEAMMGLIQACLGKVEELEVDPLSKEVNYETMDTLDEEEAPEELAAVESGHFEDVVEKKGLFKKTTKRIFVPDSDAEPEAETEEPDVTETP